MRPLRPRNWVTVGLSTSPASWDAIPRRSGWDWRNSKARMCWIRAAPVKRGWTQTVDRDQPGDRSELSQGARGSHRGRPDAARGEMDQLVTTADRDANQREGNSGQSSRGLPATPQAPIPEAEGVEEEDDGTSPPGP